MAVATVEGVSTSLGRPISDDPEYAQVLQWLNDAELQIRLRLGDVNLLDQEVLEYVEREAVILKIRNPDGHANERIDDFSFGLSPAQAAGHVLITPEWWGLLSPTSQQGAFSTRPYFEPDLPVMPSYLDWS